MADYERDLTKLFLRLPSNCHDVTAFDNPDKDGMSLVGSKISPERGGKIIARVAPTKGWEKLPSLVRLAPKKWLRANPAGLAARVADLLWAHDVVKENASGPEAVAGSEEALSLLSKTEWFGTRFLVPSWKGMAIVVFGEPEYLGTVHEEEGSGFAIVHGRNAAQGLVLDESYEHRSAPKKREPGRFKDTSADPAGYVRAVAQYKERLNQDIAKELSTWHVMWDECPRPS